MGTGNLLFFSVSYIYTLLLIVGLPVMLADGAWLPWAAKLVADFVILLPTLATFRRWNLLSAFPFLEIYLTLYVVLYPPIVLAGSAVTWKDRSFRRHPV